MVFVLSFQMSFVAPNILSTRYTGEVKGVRLQRAFYTMMLLHFVVTDPPTNCCYTLLLQTCWGTTDVVVPLTRSRQHLLLTCPLAVTL